MSQQIRAAVFPVAGRGTRFLPATKAQPKEMLPVVDRPAIRGRLAQWFGQALERRVHVGEQRVAAGHALEPGAHLVRRAGLELPLERDPVPGAGEHVRGVEVHPAVLVKIRGADGVRVSTDSPYSRRQDGLPN